MKISLLLLTPVLLFAVPFADYSTPMELQKTTNQPISSEIVPASPGCPDLESCEFNGFPLHGKIQFVENFPDITIKYVDNFPDLKVKFVENFPDDCGEWQIVENFPDIKVKVVENFPDFTVRVVDNFPGLP